MGNPAVAGEVVVTEFDHGRVHARLHPIGVVVDPADPVALLARAVGRAGPLYRALQEA